LVITMKIKNNDFIEIEYNAYTEENVLFDTTNKELALKHQILNPNVKYGPLTICVGHSQIIKGIDEALIDKNVPCEFTLNIEAEKAFGKKNPQLLKLISKNVFTKNKINPVPNLQVNIDGVVGRIKTVSGGRIIVDFNHPLANQSVKYEVKVNKIIDKLDDKINGLLELLINSKAEKITEEKDKILVEIKANINQEVLNNIAKQMSKLLEKDVSISVKQ